MWRFDNIGARIGDAPRYVLTIRWGALVGSSILIAV